MSGLTITYNLGGFDEVNYINPTPHDSKEQGHYFLQEYVDGSRAWIGGFGKTGYEDGSYLYILQGKDAAPDWKGGAYLWVSEEYAWLGTAGPKSLTFGTNDREQQRMPPHGGIELAVEDAAPPAPGTDWLRLAAIADPAHPGKLALVAYAGTNSTPTIILDNLG